MTPDEFEHLLATVALYNNHMPTDSDRARWRRVVADLPLRDCLAAVVRHSRDEPSRRLEPEHVPPVIEAMRAARQARSSRRGANGLAVPSRDG